MIKNFLLISIVASATIFSCTNTARNNEKDKTKDEADSPVMQADKIVYRFGDASVAPPYHRSYTITVVEDNLHLSINSYSDTLLSKDWPFTKEKFNAVKDRLKNLKNDGSIDESEIPNGGTSKGITLYKKGKPIFTGQDYHRTKNISGANIDLSYLIPELKELIQSTEARTEDN